MYGELCSSAKIRENNDVMWAAAVLTAIGGGPVCAGGPHWLPAVERTIVIGASQNKSEETFYWAVFLGRIRNNFFPDRLCRCGFGLMHSMLNFADFSGIFSILTSWDNREIRLMVWFQHFHLSSAPRIRHFHDCVTKIYFQPNFSTLSVDDRSWRVPRRKEIYWCTFFTFSLFIIQNLWFFLTRHLIAPSWMGKAFGDKTFAWLHNAWRAFLSVMSNFLFWFFVTSAHCQVNIYIDDACAHYKIMALVCLCLNFYLFLFFGLLHLRFFVIHLCFRHSCEYLMCLLNIFRHRNLHAVLFPAAISVIFGSSPISRM